MACVSSSGAFYCEKKKISMWQFGSTNNFVFVTTYHNHVECSYCWGCPTFIIGPYFKSFHVLAKYGVRSFTEFKKKDRLEQSGEVVVTWHKTT